MALVRDKLFWSAFSEHAQCSVTASKLLMEMLCEGSGRSALATDIKSLEHRGDAITRETVQALHQTWITPLDREEIHNLVKALDDVLDVLDSASERIILYGVTDVRPEAIELAKVVHAAVEDVARAMTLLVDVKDSAALMEVCRSIYALESQADRIARAALGRLFEERGDPFELIKWRDLFEALETATDRAEDVANIVEGIVLEHG